MDQVSLDDWDDSQPMRMGKSSGRSEGAERWQSPVECT